MEKIRIQDDLYNHVNGEKLEALVIPDDMPTAGGFTELRDDIQKLMIGEFKTMSKDGSYPNEHLERACGVFKAATNVKKKAKAGMKPALRYLSVFKKMGTVRSMNNALRDMVIRRLPLPFSIFVDTDMKDTSFTAYLFRAPA